MHINKSQISDNIETDDIETDDIETTDNFYESENISTSSNDTSNDKIDLALDDEMDKPTEKESLEHHERIVTDEDMNYVDAYIKFRGQLVILVSGLSSSGKTKLAKNISRDFKIRFLNAHNYLISGYSNTIELIKKDDKDNIVESIKTINYDTDDAIDWKRLNIDIEKHKKFGVIVTGIGFPSEHITVHIDYHLHLKLSKQNCLERRKKYIVEHKEKFPIENKIIEKKLDQFQMNKYTYPYYLDVRNRSKIDVWINVDDLTEQLIYDKAFDLLIQFFEHYLRKN